MTDIETIQNLYNRNADYEKDRLTQSPIHELEFILTTDILKKYIQQESRVLDLGSGPGVYSTYLINELNCRVGLVDISLEELNLFSKKSDSNILNNVDFMKVDSATNISWIPDSSFDHILIQGPLYHLIEEEERALVLSEAKRILKPNGIIFCAFISPHRKYISILDKKSDLIKDDEYIEKLSKGITTFSCNGIKGIQYRCWPGEARKMIKDSGFNILTIRNLEGIFSNLSSEHFPILEDVELKNRFIELARSTCEEPSLLGSTLHYLIAAQK